MSHVMTQETDRNANVFAQRILNMPLMTILLSFADTNSTRYL